MPATMVCGRTLMRSAITKSILPVSYTHLNSGNLTGLELSAESAVIMEASGGQVLLEKNADEKRPPASVTKVLTLLLIFDALADGTITPDTEVTTSEYAARCV